MKNIVLSIVVGGVLLSGCGGGGGGSDTDGGSVTPTPTTRDTEALFPHTFLLNSITSELAGGGTTKQTKSQEPSTTLDRIDQLLAGSTPLKDVFTPELLYARAMDALCYGPPLEYRDHPDGNGSNHGELPVGDLGIWTITEGNTTQACTAAELDARMKGVKDRSMSGLFLMASTLDAMYDSNQTLPAVGAGELNLTAVMPTLSDVTFSHVAITQPVRDEYHYTIAFTYQRSGTPYAIRFDTIHRAGASVDEYKGMMQYQIEDQSPHGNCGMGLQAITRKGTLVYERSSQDDFSVDSREAEFCTHSFVGGFDSEGLLDPADRQDPHTNPDGWGNNYSRFIANYKVSNQSGQYSYVWQAGPQDSHSRVLQIDLNDHDPVDGESYFGYGAQVFDPHATFGENLGLICNWVAPGNIHLPQAYAQREFLRYSSAMGVFETPTGGDDITYAPTNSCQYDGNGSFAYDRNLDGNLTVDDIAVVRVGAGTGELEFDLFSYTGSTVAEMIRNRGAHLPLSPTWP